ncbi:MAG: biopolymer transport protein ExbB [Oleiphilaceae bacterium]|jgi:biopolymer transport protein ExbB
MISDFFPSIHHLFNQGGNVLWAIAAVALIIIFFATERFIFITVSFKKQQQDIVRNWHHRDDTHSWFAYQIREAILADNNLRLNDALWIIKAGVLVCPLLGLLGTVTGMISVFDVLSYSGSGNPRLMAAGIFQATIPTMAGMVVAIIGLILRQQVLRLVRKAHSQLAQNLHFENTVTNNTSINSHPTPTKGAS